MIVGVVGAGTMGRGIAQLALQGGFEVRLYDAIPGAADKSRGSIEQGLDKAVEKGKLDAGRARSAKAALSIASDLKGLAGCGVVIEAVFEDLKVKRELFRQLDALLAADAVLATNTSSLPVAEIAASSAKPERVVGMHFFNPPVAMKLVEIIRAPRTAETAFKKAWELALALGRTPVAVKDTPGFIVNRVVRPYYLESQRLAGEGGGTFEAIDGACKSLGGLPMGPFELMDLIGLDVNLAISRSIYEASGRPERLRPQPIQEKLVAAGHHGRKTSAGFYNYKDGKAAGVNPTATALLSAGKPEAPQRIWGRISEAVSREAELARGEGVATEADIDTAVRLAMNFPKGPFEWRKERAQKA